MSARLKRLIGADDSAYKTTCDIATLVYGSHTSDEHAFFLKSLL